MTPSCDAPRVPSNGMALRECKLTFACDDAKEWNKAALELGATLCDDMMKATHVICTTTAVVCSGVCVMPEWLAECVKRGKHVAELEYRLAPLKGLEVVASGFTVAEKCEMQRVAEKCGAVFTRDLTRRCTHLVCAKPVGKKYNYSKQRDNISIVTPKWLFDSCEAGRRLDEQLYCPVGKERSQRKSATLKCAKVESMRGEGSERVLKKVGTPRSSKVETIRSGDTTEKRDAKSVARARVRRPRCSKASLLLDSVVLFMSSCPSWNKATHAPLRSKVFRLAASGGACVLPQLCAAVNTVVIVSVPVLTWQIKLIKEAQSRGVRVVGINWLQKCVESNKIVSINADPAPEWDASASASIPERASFPFGNNVTTAPQSNIFLGVRMSLGPLALHDPGALAGLQAELASGRGKVLPHNESGFVTTGVPTHVMCPKSLNEAETAIVNAIRAYHSRVILVTQAWVQACVEEKRFLQAKDCVLFAPVRRVDIPDMAKIQISITGFPWESKDRNRRRSVLAELIRMLGATYQDRLRKKKTSVLVVDDEGEVAASDKVSKAKDWDIPIVSHSWLIACAAQGIVVPMSQYPLRVRKRKSWKARAKPPLPESMGSQIAPNTQQAPMPDVSTISLFTKFATTLRNNAGDDAVGEKEVGAEEAISSALVTTAGTGTTTLDEARRSSRSVSLDALDWSDEGEVPGSVSQSQVIVHRDLTPPPSPNRRTRRSMPPRAAKAKRAKISES